MLGSASRLQLNVLHICQNQTDKGMSSLILPTNSDPFQLESIPKMKVIYFLKQSPSVADTKVSVVEGLTFHRWLCCQIIITLISSSDCPILNYVITHIHLNDHTKSAIGKLCALLGCLLSVPAPMAGSVMYHLEAQSRLLQRCFACSMLVKSEHKHCGKLSLVNLKNHNKSYWITNVIAVIVLKPKLLNALKFGLILKYTSLV